MFLKLIRFRSLISVFPRGVYFASGEVDSHRDLESIKRRFFGPEVRGVFSLHRLAVRAVSKTWGQRQRAREYAYFEFIISTPEGTRLSEREELDLLQTLLDELGLVGAMTGIHRHKDGRTDMHVFAANETIAGAAIGVDLTLLSTGRRFRNPEVVARQIMDKAHDELNMKRAKDGRSRIPTIKEVRSAEREQRRFEELCKAAKDADKTAGIVIPDVISATPVVEIAAAAILVTPGVPLPANECEVEPLEQPLDGKGRLIPPEPTMPAEIAVPLEIAVAAMPSLTNESLPALSGNTAHKKPSIPPIAPSTKDWNWEDLIALLDRWFALRKEAAKKAKDLAAAEKRMERWFRFDRGRPVLLDVFQAELDRDHAKGIEAADELAMQISIVSLTLDEMEYDLEMDGPTMGG
jgi:hypothetical protein